MPINITSFGASTLPLAIFPPALLYFFSTFNAVVCCELIGFFGIVGNIINIMNFKKQGLKDSVNVTLLALSVSDLGALVVMNLLNISSSPFWDNLELPFLTMAEFATGFYYPHSYFIKASGFITAFAAFERCLCVVVPLRVKFIITRNVAIVVNVFIFLLLALYLFPEFYVTYPGWIQKPYTNRTVITIMYRSNAETFLFLHSVINELFVPYVTFAVLICCTTIIIIKLKSKAKWRRSLTSQSVKTTADKGQLSRKEKKTVVLLAVVSTIYVLCLIPQCIMMTFVGVIPDLKAGRPYYEISYFVFCFTSLLETINCSVSIIVYYKMSSKYREHVPSWFKLPGKS